MDKISQSNDTPPAVKNLEADKIVDETLKGNPEPELDRISEILAHLNSDSDAPLPEHLRRKNTTPLTAEYLQELEDSLANHPFFITQSQLDSLSPTEPLPPLLDALQQLKYSPEENSPHELAVNYKSDALFQFKHGKYRIAATIFSEALKYSLIHKEDVELTANLYNNRGVCQFHVKNYRSALQDFRLALTNKKDYTKSWRKAIECCLKLEKETEGLEILKNGEDIGLVDEWGLKTKLQLEIRHKSLTKLKSENALQECKREQHIVLEKIRKSCVKMQNENFLQEDNTEDNVVKIVNGSLVWPVLFYYPEYSTSDLVKEFDAQDEFSPHLYEMLDSDSPHWDKDKKYNAENVSIYYVDGIKGGWVKVGSDEKLGDVLRQERYILPSNGVPGFFILANNSEFCKFFLERMS